MSNPRWLEWGQRLQALAQSGLNYTKSPFERERYEAIRKIACEMIVTQSDLEFPIVQNIIKSEGGYATPKLDVRAVIIRDDSILLVREQVDGRWSLPGGWIDVNDSPGRAAEKEVFEETGYRVRSKKLLAVWDRNLHGHPPFIFHLFKLVFLCEILGGQPTTSIETTAVQFFQEDELPPLSLTRTTPEQIERLFEHYRHPDWPSEFD
jgi:ADP-ribose pyrophosphatase YjhB (NUDIX family)